jgi:hypothetical protein
VRDHAGDDARLSPEALRVVQARITETCWRLAVKGTRQWRERRAAMAEACGSRCWYCGRVVSLATEDARTPCAGTIDHQTPRDSGGDDADNNLVLACFACNSQKGTWTVEEYRAYLVACDPHSRLVSAITLAFRDGVEESPELVAAQAWALRHVPSVVFFGERG